jgi:acyl-lipid omega-6 desaturase (Delta-12 desaturase)
LLLAAPRVWADTHNYHHAHTAKLDAAPIGTYVLWTVDRWRSATKWERWRYRLERHPLTIGLGYLTVFFVGMCVLPFVLHPRRYASSGLAAFGHLAIAFGLWHTFGLEVALSAFVAPFAIACAVGSYLFYAQHNAPGLTLCSPENWNHADGALGGSTYLATGPLMRWFTGNIGFHHVHHLNVRIPFYRLPEAMAAIPELGDPVVTRLRLQDVRACLRLAIWDPVAGRMMAASDVT